MRPYGSSSSCRYILKPRRNFCKLCGYFLANFVPDCVAYRFVNRSRPLVNFCRQPKSEKSYKFREKSFSPNKDEFFNLSSIFSTIFHELFYSFSPIRFNTFCTFYSIFCPFFCYIFFIYSLYFLLIPNSTIRSRSLSKMPIRIIVDFHSIFGSVLTYRRFQIKHIRAFDPRISRSSSIVI